MDARFHAGFNLQVEFAYRQTMDSGSKHNVNAQSQVQPGFRSMLTKYCCQDNAATGQRVAPHLLAETGWAFGRGTSLGSLRARLTVCKVKVFSASSKRSRIR
jgi:hypothetical protein